MDRRQDIDICVVTDPLSVRLHALSPLKDQEL